MAIAINRTPLTRIQLPGRAGQFQRAGAMGSLVRELGDNYAEYHEFLRAELAKIGKPPERDDFPDMGSYLEEWARAQEIVRVEAFLRNCRGYRRFGEPLDRALDKSVKLVSEDHRLVSVE